MANLVRLALWSAAAGVTLFCAKKHFIEGPMCKSKAKLIGKTVIITGANTGIGLETALDLASRGARVILACRNEEKGKEAVEVVTSKSRNPNVVFSKLNLSSLKSVRDFSSKTLREEPRIDILINNAGILNFEYAKTEDGFEEHFGVNHLSHFLLTNLLLDRMKQSPSARIVNVASRGHTEGKIDFDDLEMKDRDAMTGRYGTSKLANILFTRSLAKRLEGSRVETYCLHPGLIDTEIFRHNRWYQVVRLIAPLFLQSTLRGAQTTIHCAVSDEATGHSGEYFVDCKVAETSNPQATDDLAAEQLWDTSAKLVGLPSDK